MSLGARDKAISTFAENPDCQIMIASLRCGGRKYIKYNPQLTFY